MRKQAPTTGCRKTRRFSRGNAVCRNVKVCVAYISVNSTVSIAKHVFCATVMVELYVGSWTMCKQWSTLQAICTFKVNGLCLTHWPLRTFYARQPTIRLWCLSHSYGANRITGSPTSPRSSHCDSSIRAWLSVGTTNPFPWVPQDRIWATTISASSSFTNFIPFVPWVMNCGSLQKLWFIQWCHMGIVLCHKCLQENVKWICDDMFSVVYYFLWNNPLWHQETINQRTILKQSSCLKYQ